jgi:hypothetical protein
LRELLALCRLGTNTTEALKAARDLADLLVSRGGVDAIAEASSLAEEALAGLRTALGEAHASPLTALRVRGSVRAAQGDLCGAEADLRASLEGLRLLESSLMDKLEIGKSARELARVLRLRGDEAGAAAADAVADAHSRGSAGSAAVASVPAAASPLAMLNAPASSTIE